jgi:molybdopterin-guanine dinucleotide biosynthesis protein A
MGVDKASLEFEGRPLAARVLEALREVSAEVLVASGDGRRLAWLGARQVPDAIPQAGPLSALVAGLERARQPVTAVVAVDMPFASPAVLRLLADLVEEHDAAVPVTDAGLQPLHAVYAAGAAPLLRRQLDRGERSVRRALSALSVREVRPEEWLPADPTGRFAGNLNLPEDLPGG